MLPLARNDILHLHSQLSAATKKKLDLYLPNVDQDDSLKKRVSDHVDEFILELFQALEGNISVMDSDDKLVEIIQNKQLTEVEPFDFNLSEQIRKLFIQVEEETVKLTKLRKNGPNESIQEYQNSFNELINSLESENNEEDINFEQKEIKLNLQDSYNQSINQIINIKESIPNQRNELIKIEKISKFLSKEK